MEEMQSHAIVTQTMLVNTIIQLLVIFFDWDYTQCPNGTEIKYVLIFTHVEDMQSHAIIM